MIRHCGDGEKKGIASQNGKTKKKRNNNETLKRKTQVYGEWKRNRLGDNKNKLRKPCLREKKRNGAPELLEGLEQAREKKERQPRSKKPVDSSENRQKALFTNKLQCKKSTPTQEKKENADQSQGGGGKQREGKRPTKERRIQGRLVPKTTVNRDEVRGKKGQR